MKVYCTPVEIVCTSGRYSASTFLSQNAAAKTEGMDYSNKDKDVIFRFYENGDVFSCVILTIKKAKSYCSANKVKTDFSLVTHGTGGKSVSETNLLIINKKNLKGVYVHNEGSMPLTTFEGKLRSFYYSSLRTSLSTSKKRDEVISLSRLIGNNTLMDKIKKYSFVDEINVSFSNSTTASRFLNSSVYNKTKTIRVTMRTNNLSIKKRKEKDDLAKYLKSLVNASANNISFKGRETDSSEGETVALVDKACSIETLDHDDYLSMLDGVKLSEFFKSKLFDEMKELVLSNKLTK